MSFSQQALEDLQYSFNSLYTPSYSIAGLLPLASPEEDFAPQKPTSRKTSESPSSASPSDESLKHESSPLDKTEILFSSSPLEKKQAEPTAPHYRKLKMNYFRKLNVVQGTIVSSETHEVAQKSPRTGKTDKSPKPTPSTSKFTPSFTATPTRSSQPIKIPSSTKPSKSSRQRFEEETNRDGKKKSSQMAFSLKREDSLDHFGVFDSDFEM